MSTKTIAKLLSSDPKFVAQFMISPKETLADFGVDAERLDKTDVHALETVVQLTQDSLRANSRLIGVELAAADWGIGGGCCNSKSVVISQIGARRR